MKNETLSEKKMLFPFNKFSPLYCNITVSGPDPTCTELEGLFRFMHSSIRFGRTAFLLKIKHVHKCLLEQSLT